MKADSGFNRKSCEPAIRTPCSSRCFITLSAMGIEPIIGHCRADRRFGSTFYKGLFGDSINVVLASAGFNFKRAIRLLFCPFLESFYRLLDALCGCFWSVFAVARPSWPSSLTLLSTQYGILRV